MGTIIQLLESMRRVDLPNEVPRIIEETKAEIIRLNQIQLYTRSIDSDGNPLQFYRSISYSFEKERLNPLPGFGKPDLYVTGAFYRGFGVAVDKNVFTVSSSDDKTAKLTAEYGTSIFGLTQESKSNYAIETVYPKIQAYITRLTGLQFSI